LDRGRRAGGAGDWRRGCPGGVVRVGESRNWQRDVRKLRHNEQSQLGDNDPNEQSQLGDNDPNDVHPLLVHEHPEHVDGDDNGDLDLDREHAAHEIDVERDEHDSPLADDHDQQVSGESARATTFSANRPTTGDVLR
jgi:hypothetical protein